jgi:hypothetical protein
LPERGHEKNQGKSKQALHHIHIHILLVFCLRLSLKARIIAENYFPFFCLRFGGEGGEGTSAMLRSQWPG